MSKKYHYGEKSKKNLSECHPLIQEVFNEVIKITDCSIIEGHRGQAEQDIAYEKGFSKVKFPDSKHNVSPSMAVDALPYPIDWEDRERLCLFAGVVLGVAHLKGVSLRWGGDFNGNFITSDEHFTDMFHFELIEDEK